MSTKSLCLSLSQKEKDKVLTKFSKNAKTKGEKLQSLD